MYSFYCVANGYGTLPFGMGIAHVQYIKILTRLQGFLVIFLVCSDFFVFESLSGSCETMELRKNNLQFVHKALKSCWNFNMLNVGYSFHVFYTYCFVFLVFFSYFVIQLKSFLFLMLYDHLFIKYNFFTTTCAAFSFAIYKWDGCYRKM